MSAEPQIVTKAEIALRTLRRRILDLELAPGAPIAIDETAKTLGVSAIPLREALQVLAVDGLIELRPHLGPVVAPVTRTSVVELYTLLEGLEVAACRHALARARAADRDTLEHLLKELDKTSAGRDAVTWIARNAEFHLALAAPCGLPRVLTDLRRAFDHWGRVRRVFFSDGLPGSAAGAGREHRAMVDAFATRDEAVLERLLRDHNRSALGRALERLPAAVG